MVAIIAEEKNRIEFVIDVSCGVIMGRRGRVNNSLSIYLLTL